MTATDTYRPAVPCMLTLLHRKSISGPGKGRAYACGKFASLINTPRPCTQPALQQSLPVKATALVDVGERQLLQS